MLSIKDVYEKFDEIGCCSFATLDGNGGVDSRIAHFFAYDDEGLYLRTMTGKPFFRQMIEGGRLSVCGERTDAPVVHDARERQRAPSHRRGAFRQGCRQSHVRRGDL